MIQIKMALMDEYEKNSELIPPEFAVYYKKDRTYVMHMEEGGSLLGIGSVTTLPDGKALVNDALLFQEDAGMMDGLLRALLNFLDICGVQYVMCQKESLYPALKLLGFSACEGGVGRYLKGLFDSSC